MAIPTDVGDPAAVEAMRSHVLDELGSPSIVVNAAGVFGPIQLIKDSDPAEWVATIMIDAVAPYLVTRAFVGGMVEAGWGRIVNITSAASLHPPGPMNSAYGTAKVALNQFTRHLAAELAGTGVTANVLHPGDVKTDMWADIRDRVDRRRSVGRGLRAMGPLGGRDRRRSAVQGGRRRAARSVTTPRPTSPGSSAGSTIRYSRRSRVGTWWSTSGPGPATTRRPREHAAAAIRRAGDGRARSRCRRSSLPRSAPSSDVVRRAATRAPDRHRPRRPPRARTGRPDRPCTRWHRAPGP